MRHYQKLLTVCSALLILAIPPVQAHTEKDKARFVDQNGKDTGDCKNVLRPCKTIEYAVERASKGDSVLVAAGTYEIQSASELFYLNNAIIPILGGFNRFDHFQVQSPDINSTRLVGVPSDMVENLRKLGFAVIADGKNSEINQKLQSKMAEFDTLNHAKSDVACTDGNAQGHSCLRVDLLAHLPLSDFAGNHGTGSDIWGHVDLNTNREYAIITLSRGTAVVDVTTPTTPNIVGVIPGKPSIWRDAKVYQYYDDTLNAWQAYAYITIDQSSDYVSIIDLNELPNRITEVQKSQVVSQAHNVYISNVDYTFNTALEGQTPTLQIIGGSTYGGAFHSYSLENPRDITVLDGQSGAGGYTHDGTSMTISDERAARDCGEEGGTCTVFLDFNEKELKLWNVTNPETPRLLSSTTYDDVPASAKYIHSGWWSEDNQYLFVHDEFDEQNAGLNTTVRVYDMSSLTEPTQVTTWTGPTRATDHNGYVKGSRYYMSTYQRGLTVLDITDPTRPQQIGYFDTYPIGNGAALNGAWGVYPYLPSGNILVSDMQSGLFVLKDNTKTSENGSLSFETSQVTGEEGDTLVVSVTREEGAAGSVEVSYTTMVGSASATDFTPVNGVFSWADGETGSKQVSIALNNDTVDNEYDEMFFVKLFNPTNGATLGTTSYVKVNIDGIENRGAISIAQPDYTVAETDAEVSVAVNRIGGISGTASVSYRLESDSAEVGADVEETTGTLTWADQENETKTISITILDDETFESEESFKLIIESSGGTSLGNTETIITIEDNESNSAPEASAGENFQVNTSQFVTLNGSATDPDGQALTYAWEQTAGSQVEMNSTDTLTPNFYAPTSADVLTFELTATDSLGATHSASVTISVIAAPTQPDPAPPVQGSSSGGGGSFGIAMVTLLGLGLLGRRNKKLA